MPKQTLSDAVSDIKGSVISLDENVDRCIKDIERLQADYRGLVEVNSQQHREIAVLQTEIEHLKSKTEEFDRRRWTLVVALISAAIGGAFAFAAQFTARALIK